MHVLAADPRASVVRTDVRTLATQVSQGNMAVNDHSTIHHCKHTRRPGRSHSPSPSCGTRARHPRAQYPFIRTPNHPNTQTPKHLTNSPIPSVLPIHMDHQMDMDRPTRIKPRVDRRKRDGAVVVRRGASAQPRVGARHRRAAARWASGTSWGSMRWTRRRRVGGRARGWGRRRSSTGTTWRTAPTAAGGFEPAVDACRVCYMYVGFVLKSICYY